MSHLPFTGSAMRACIQRGGRERRAPRLDAIALPALSVLSAVAASPLPGAHQRPIAALRTHSRARDHAMCKRHV